MAAKLRCGDEVIVLSGKDKGKRGKIKLVLMLDKVVKVVVEGINLVKKHQKPTAQAPGGIIEKESPLYVSKVAIFNPETGKADRIGFRLENDKKVRFFKSNGKNVA